MRRLRTPLLAVATALVASSSMLSSCGTTSTADRLVSTPVTSSDGSMTTIGAYLHDRPLLISLWAVWCQPCRRELPEIAAISSDAASGVDVLALNIGDDQGRIDGFLADLGIVVPVAVDADGTALEVLDAATVPVTVIVDVDGDVVWEHMGAVTRAEIDAALSGL